jgi:hypothetical protein
VDPSVPELGQARRRITRERLDDLDRVDLVGELRENGRLIAAAGAHLEHARVGPEGRQLAHQRHNERLADRLIVTDRQRTVVVGAVAQRLGNERMSRHTPHRFEHARVADPGRGELLAHHALARCLHVVSHGGHRLPA